MFHTFQSLAETNAGRRKRDSSLTRNFLKLVYTFPILYDHDQKYYKNLKNKDTILNDIGKWQMPSDFYTV